MAVKKPTRTPATDEQAGRVISNPNADLEQRRQALEDALAQRAPKRDAAEEGRQEGAGSGFGAALKMSSEFVAGILVGAGLGYLLDLLAGTTPWGLIVFLFLGFAAGVLNVLRAAGRVAQPADGARGERLRGNGAGD
ncbi:MAG: AtpZ/AtpI family protein [Roseitalea sp.]|jgi:ATP synthase protein I|nr:AtpZ/AtpI family protein [Roseitalea sp.]MBO6721718.1 AtpZ/AtpI family protein [Roseitalea sp.]MBO6743493.1 AtpZ/AtpI family protein [Roseitalea sp.]